MKKLQRDEIYGNIFFIYYQMVFSQKINITDYYTYCVLSLSQMEIMS